MENVRQAMHRKEKPRKPSACPRESGKTGKNGKCICPSGQKACARACIPAAAECAGGQVCLDFQCVTGLGACAAGTTIRDVSAVGACNPGPAAHVCARVLDLNSETHRAVSTGDNTPCTKDADCAGFGVGAFCSAAAWGCPDQLCRLPCPR